MKELVETVIPSNIDKELLRAFLHGHVHGKYKFFYSEDTDTVAIQFVDGESAAYFKLKDLDKVFMQEFGNMLMEQIKQQHLLDRMKILRDSIVGNEHKKVMYPGNNEFTKWELPPLGITYYSGNSITTVDPNKS